MRQPPAVAPEAFQAAVRLLALWGTEARLEELFAGHRVQTTRKIYNFRYKPAAHWLEVFKIYYGPTNRAFAALDAGKQEMLQARAARTHCACRASISRSL